jgi:hypothetical protein
MHNANDGGGFAVLRSRTGADNAAALFLTEQPAFAMSRRMTTPQGRALSHLSQIARAERFTGPDTWPHLVELARRPDRMAALFAGRAASIIRPTRLCAVRLFCETTPDYESRVRLTNERDSLGLPRAEVVWRVREEDKRGPARLLADLREVLGAQGASLDADFQIGPGHPWPASFVGGKHHMGTTRMGDSSRTGVVDATGRVHGLANLYVAGSSVFPSSGWANPTLTIVALALRLSDELCSGHFPSADPDRFDRLNRDRPSDLRCDIRLVGPVVATSGLRSTVKNTTMSVRGMIERSVARRAAVRCHTRSRQKTT